MLVFPCLRSARDVVRIQDIGAPLAAQGTAFEHVVPHGDDAGGDDLGEHVVDAEPIDEHPHRDYRCMPPHPAIFVFLVEMGVVDIMLNLKNIKFKAHTDSPVELRLEKTGAGIITAKDIKANAEMEVVNPDQIIATIDDDKTKLNLQWILL